MQQNFTLKHSFLTPFSPKSIIVTVCVFLFFVTSTLAQAPLVSLQNGKLVYNKYANQGQANADNQIPDFSNAGYKGGGVAIPVLDVKETVQPVTGDCLALIQAAIDKVSALPADANGFRGAVLLKAGIYPVEGSLTIRTSGVVLRGEGTGVTGTVLIATQKKQHNFINIQGSGSGYGEVSGTKVRVSSSYVPTGSKTFDVGPHTFSVGDKIVVQRTPNEAWIDVLNMRQYGWTTASYRSTFERQITAVNGNTISIDIPIVDPIEQTYGGADVFKSNIVGRITNSGVENIRIESDFASNEDESHAWEGVVFNRAENCWARNVIAKYFGFSAVNATNMSRFITVEDCAMIDPKSVTTGGRKYSFNIESNSTGILVQRCMTWGGRHDFVSGSRVPGPNVFLDCIAENTFSDIGPHHRWSTGQIYDNVFGGQIRVQDRGASGTGHGWAGAQILFWNCYSNKSDIEVQSPPTARNWGIGCIGLKQTNNGYWESWGTHVLPRSLYLQQLEERLGAQAVLNVTTTDQLQNTLRNKMKARITEIVSEPKVLYGSPDGDVSAFDITDNGGVLTSQYVSNRPTENFPNIIDNLLNTKYYQNGRKALWVQYRSSVPAVVTRYTISSANDVEDRDPKDWTLSGSNNGTTWKVLDTRSNEDFPTRLLTRSFSVANTETFLFYRLTITNNSGNNNTQFSEWELYQRKYQTITSSEIPEKTFGDEPFQVVVSSNSALPVSLEVVSGPATIDSEGYLTITGAGTVTIRASQAGNDNYFPASIEQTFVVKKADQTIAFEAVGEKTYGDAPFVLSASSDAGLPVVFEVVSGPVSISGSTVTITSAGTAVVKASAEGNENYNAASTEQTFIIKKAAQSISFQPILPANKTATVQLEATSSSGLPVTYQVISGPGTVNGTVLSFTGEGEVVVRAIQAGNENYLAAVSVDQTVLVYGDDEKKDGIKIKVYPNPTDGQLKVKLDNKKDKEYTFTIFNSQGVAIQSAVIQKSHKVFDVDFNLENAENGLYYLHVSDGTEKIVRTIVKQ